MRLSNIAKLEKELVGQKRHKRALFPQVRCDARLFNLVRSKKRKAGLTWEEALTDMGIDWLKNGK